jgi:hypothetical protein
MYYVDIEFELWNISAGQALAMEISAEYCKIAQFYTNHRSLAFEILSLNSVAQHPYHYMLTLTPN